MTSGGAAALSEYAGAAGVQAGAVVGSDIVHNLLGMYPTALTSAVATGAMYSAAMGYGRGEDDYAMNFGVSAGSEFASRTLGNMWNVKKNQDAAAAVAAEDGSEAF